MVTRNKTNNDDRATSNQGSLNETQNDRVQTVK